MIVQPDHGKQGAVHHILQIVRGRKFCVLVEMNCNLLESICGYMVILCGQTLLHRSIIAISLEKFHGY